MNSLIRKAMANVSQSLTGLNELPGDRELGPRPGVIECFSTMSRKQWLGTGVIALVIATGIVLWVVGWAAM